MSAIRCIAFRPDCKGTRKGFIDFELGEIVIRDCVWHESRGKEWIGFPAENTAPAGAPPHWKPLVVFAEGADRETFQREAVQSIYRHLNKEAAGESLPMLLI
jgi:hypothetical protein